MLVGRELCMVWLVVRLTGVREAVDIGDGCGGVDWRLAESCCWIQSIVMLVLRMGGLSVVVVRGRSCWEGEGVRRGRMNGQVGRRSGCHGSGRSRRVALMVGGY